MLDIPFAVIIISSRAGGEFLIPLGSPIVHVRRHSVVGKCHRVDLSGQIDRKPCWYMPPRLVFMCLCLVHVLVFRGGSLTGQSDSSMGSGEYPHWARRRLG